MKLKEILKEVEKLNLPKEEFYIEGNAALVVRKILDSTDIINICTTKENFDNFKSKYNLDMDENRNIIWNAMVIRMCKKNNFDIEKSQPYNIEDINKRLYILLELNKNDNLKIIKKIKEYIGPSLFFVKNIEEYELEKSRGAKLEQKDYKGETPLFRAVRNNNFELVKRMIKDGANINELDSSNNNLGFFCNNLEILKFLVENGLELKEKNNDKKTC